MAVEKHHEHERPIHLDFEIVCFYYFGHGTFFVFTNTLHRIVTYFLISQKLMCCTLALPVALVMLPIPIFLQSP